MFRFLPWSVQQFLLDHAPLGAYRWLVPRDVLSVCYHTASDRPPAHIKHLFDCRQPRALEADLIYLGTHYTLVGYEQVERIRAGKERAPRNAFLVTFDDAYAECFTTVRGMLLKHDTPCVFFVTTGCLDNGAMFYRNKVSLCIDRALRLDDAGQARLRREINRLFGLAVETPAETAAWAYGLGYADLPRIDTLCSLLQVDVTGYLTQQKPYLTTDQVRQLARDGFTIGAHGVSHGRLQDLRSPAEIEREIVESCQVVRQITGGKRIPFAFPFNGAGIDRTFLADIRRTHDVVGLYFDLRGLQEDQPLVVQRLVADCPHGASPAVSNLPEKLRKLYVEQLRLSARQTGAARRANDAGLPGPCSPHPRC